MSTHRSFSALLSARFARLYGLDSWNHIVLPELADGAILWQARSIPDWDSSFMPSVSLTPPTNGMRELIGDIVDAGISGISPSLRGEFQASAFLLIMWPESLKTFYHLNNKKFLSHGFQDLYKPSANLILTRDQYVCQCQPPLEDVSASSSGDIPQIISSWLAEYLPTHTQDEAIAQLRNIKKSLQHDLDIVKTVDVMDTYQTALDLTNSALCGLICNHFVSPGIRHQTTIPAPALSVRPTPLEHMPEMDFESKETLAEGQ